ncbi:hypothetical protein [Desulfovirgula thermocuniculi]|uniref:hypothetical protein n=1 Tax=Desulfovirgula thermocuniculi TaxID=348842 RepID=UPI0004137E1E|nr:hypothetical protein [Desulfovirgula thermocuniculi]
MLHVVSVSLGSTARDHRAEIVLLGRKILVERRGTDGSLRRAARLLRELDGRVDAISLGGIDLYLFAGPRRYTFKDALRLAGAVRHTPLVDGSGIKETWEPHVVELARQEIGLPQEGQKVLLASALDRWPLAEAFARAGCRLMIGDALFALGLPLVFSSLDSFATVARVFLPFFCRLPIALLYPTGKRQEKSRPRFAALYRQADILAGDFHFLRRYLPQDLGGKAVFTSTLTRQDVEELAQRGVRWLVTFAPEMEGRWFGANVLEAICTALLKSRGVKEIKPSLYRPLLAEAGLAPGIYRLN